MSARTPLSRELVAERPKLVFGICIYCGRRSYGPACPAHRDLLLVDPHQVELRRRGV